MTNIQEILNAMDYGPAPESSDLALKWIAQHQPFGAFINGRWHASPNSFETFNPTSGEPLAHVSLGTSADVNEAVAAAKSAAPAWAALSGGERAQYLYAITRAIQKHARLAAVLETLDNGKPIRESRDVDIPLVIRHFYHHVGWAQVMEQRLPGRDPLGVVGQIVPWNFPMLMLAWKVAPALACGNTIVFKSAENTPLTALLFAQICDEVGLPPGVFNLVNGAVEVGRAIVQHPDINKIAFTGSTAVGRWIRQTTAGTGKKLSLELGGKSPFIVFADADLDSAIEGLIDSTYFNQGQVCCAGSRLLVHESIAETFTTRLRQRMSKLRVGDPMDKSTDMGPLVSMEQHQTVSRYLDVARQEGATVWQSTDALPGRGCFLAPTLITGVGTASTVVREEIFGPVLTVLTFRTPAEAVQLANNTVYGLAASVWSESINQALDIAPQLLAGVVWINGANLFDASCGFGGYKESGFGREGGIEGLREYLKPRTRKAKKPVLGIETATELTREAIDQTVKLYVGGKQVRPDSGYSRKVMIAGRCVAVVPEGNRKDIRNAVEAAANAKAWTKRSGHERAQVLYYVAENLNKQREGLLRTLRQAMKPAAAKRELDASLHALFTFAAWADKYDGTVHQPPLHGIVTALNEPIGVIGVVCQDANPLSGLFVPLSAALSQGNRIVAVPSRSMPHIIADVYQVLETSDVPAGVVNLITASVNDVLKPMSTHAEVQAIWVFDGDGATTAAVERESAATLMRTWVPSYFDPMSLDELSVQEFLEQATQVKNVWIPYGV